MPKKEVKNNKRFKEEVKKLVVKSNVVQNEIEKAKDRVVRKITSPFIQDKRRLTIGEKTADSLAKWAGSWVFIISFGVFLAFWMALNTYFWARYQFSAEPFDPYPFILLNLVLSCIAAIQAPVILMSQNRAAERDRLRSEYDYQINRKSEREIQELKKQLDRIERKLNNKK